jgi:hypothetical protein
VAVDVASAALDVNDVIAPHLQECATSGTLSELRYRVIGHRSCWPLVTVTFHNPERNCVASFAHADEPPLRVRSRFSHCIPPRADEPIRPGRSCLPYSLPHTRADEPLGSKLALLEFACVRVK